MVNIIFFITFAHNKPEMPHENQKHLRLPKPQNA